MSTIKLKIDSIELKFKSTDGTIQSIESFSAQFERGFYLVEHPKKFKDIKIEMYINSNLGNHTCGFGFNQKDVEWGHYLVDKLVQKWTIIWEWFYQAWIDSKISLDEEQSEINHDNLDWVLDFDDKNSFSKIRDEKLYYDHDLKALIDLEYSLPAIRKVISQVDLYARKNDVKND